jgi:hypothetical protein
MKGSNIIIAIQNLRLAEEQFLDFVRQNPNSRGERIFGVYVSKIRWIFNDLLTNPHLPFEVTNGLKEEINGDVLALPAIYEKIAMLGDYEKEVVETIIDAIHNGEKITITDKQD